VERPAVVSAEKSFRKVYWLPIKLEPRGERRCQHPVVDARLLL
jgi:hypothetical protein